MGVKSIRDRYPWYDMEHIKDYETEKIILGKTWKQIEKAACAIGETPHSHEEDNETWQCVTGRQLYLTGSSKGWSMRG